MEAAPEESPKIESIYAQWESLSYSDINPLPAGGFSWTYSAFYDGQKVCLKMLSPKVLAEQERTVPEKRFNQEVVWLRKCKHQNIITLAGTTQNATDMEYVKLDCLDFDKIPNDIRLFLPMDKVPFKINLPFYCMEFCEGGSLREQIQEHFRNKNPIENKADALKITSQVAYALWHFHNLDSPSPIHRDLKPENILFKGDQCKVSDFGMVKDWNVDLTMTGDTARLGTQGYFAPEQILREQISYKADIYALGVVLYETMTGNRIPPVCSLTEKMQRMNELEDPFLWNLCFSMLSIAPEHRPEAWDVHISIGLQEYLGESKCREWSEIVHRRISNKGWLMLKWDKILLIIREYLNHRRCEMQEKLKQAIELWKMILKGCTSPDNLAIELNPRTKPPKPFEPDIASQSLSRLLLEIPESSFAMITQGISLLKNQQWAHKLVQDMTIPEDEEQQNTIVTFLIWLLLHAEKNEPLQNAIQTKLEKSNIAWTKPLIQVLYGEDYNTRIASLETLTLMGTKAIATVPALIFLLDRTKKQEALKAIAKSLIQIAMPLFNGLTNVHQKLIEAWKILGFQDWQILAFQFVRETSYTCGGITNTVLEFEHEKTGMDFVYIPACRGRFLG